MRIGISGAHSTGKTTLLNALRSEPAFFNYHIGDEVTRRIASYGIPINEQGTDITQILVMQEHLVNVVMHENLLTDRTALDGYSYTLELHEMGVVSDKVLAHADAIFKKVVPMYDILFYIRPEFAIEDDGVRTTDILFRDKILSRFEQVISAHHLPVVLLSGTVRERLNQFFKTFENPRF